MEKDPQDPYEYEVDLRDYINVIWNQKWIILVIFVLAAGLAAGYSMTQPEVYETESTLLITPRISEQIVKNDGSSSGLSSVTLPPSAYERAAMATDLMEKIIRSLELKGQEGELISVASLKNRMEINVETQTRESTRESNGTRLDIPIVTMKVKGTDPEEIKRIGNKWAGLFQERTTELFASETARSFQFISSRFQEVESELRSLEKEKQQYRENNPLSTLTDQVSVLANQYTNFLSRLEQKKEELNSKESRLEELKGEFETYDPLSSIRSDQLKSEYRSLFASLQVKQRKLESQSVRLSEIKNTLNGIPKFIEPERAVSKEAIWNFLEGEISENRLKNLPNLKVRDQEKNSVFFSLQNDLVQKEVTVNTLKKDIPQLESRIKKIENALEGDSAKIKVSNNQRKTYYNQLWNQMTDLSIEVDSLKKEVSYLEGKTKELQKSIEQKRQRIDRVKLKLEQLNRNIDRLKNSYKTLSDNLVEARTAKEEKESSIRIMERAVAPEKPIASNTKQNVAVAGVLGLFLGVLVAFFRNYMQGYEEEEKEAHDKTSENQED